MDIDGWKYYNHAAIPTTPPHLEPDLRPIKDGTIWKLNGNPLLARWSTDFDCGYETEWWYVIKDAPFSLDDISSKNQKSIRQALRKCDVRQIDVKDYFEEIYECYSSAYTKYENADNMLSKDKFFEFCNNQSDNTEYWAGFDKETGKLIGYLTVSVYDIFTELCIAKFNPEFSNRRVSDALYYTVLEHYLNNCGKKYISSGTRNINHKTNTQEYKIKRFGFRKAYCNLHIVYNPKVSFIMKIIYIFRNLLKKFDRITLIHQINSLVLMEEFTQGKLDR